ncbi:uncharacterized protein ACN427_014047 isoform 1-T1 [Glossina fuscipes fuscipes]
MIMTNRQKSICIKNISNSSLCAHYTESVLGDPHIENETSIVDEKLSNTFGKPSTADSSFSVFVDRHRFMFTATSSEKLQTEENGAWPPRRQAITRRDHMVIDVACARPTKA